PRRPRRSAASDDRFTALGEVSPVGRTRTAPNPQTSPDLLRFGVVSCANREDAAALRAYSEWMPVRNQGSAAAPRIYRRLRFGTLAELSMLDLRSYRDEQPRFGTVTATIR